MTDTEAASATLRALADDPSLRLRAGRPFRGQRRLGARAPHLHEVGTAPGARGQVDAWAQHASLTDAALHAANLPTDPLAAMIFETLEQLRVEALVRWPGGRSNLRALHEEWVATWRRTGALDSEAGMVVFAALQMARARVSGDEVDGRVSDLIESARFALAPEIGGDLRALSRHRDDQQAYAVHARSMAERVAALVDEVAPAQDAPDGAAPHDGLPMLLEDLESDETPLVGSGHSAVLAEAPDGYAVFTREHDEQARLDGHFRPAALERLRGELDELVRSADLSISRLARDLRAAFEVQEPTAWSSGAEDGQLDARALTRVVTAPRDPRIHRDRVLEPTGDATVTVLLDCSGSMRTHAPTLVVALTALTRAVELLDGSCEVLGFTTRAWTGGRAVKDWRRAGRPPRPGRLNERLHLVLVEADAPRRHVRRGLAGLLQGHWFREGLDGEAVQWACDRLRSRPAGRRVLVVVSDGSPMDTATHGANDEHYLEHHLREVVAEQGRSGDVEVVGLGIGGEAGADLSPFYDRCTEVSTVDAAGVLRALVQLLGPR